MATPAAGVATAAADVQTVAAGVPTTAVDVAMLAAGLGAALHAAGLPVGPDRCERLARALSVMQARTLTELHACALATLVSDPSQASIFEHVFATLFAGRSSLEDLPLPATPAVDRSFTHNGSDTTSHDTRKESGGWLPGLLPQLTDAGQGDDGTDDEAPGTLRFASAAERLRGRDFARLSDGELSQLVALMRDMTLAVPPRRTRRYRHARDGKRPDLRGTLRQARRSGGEPIRLSHHAPRHRPRRLVVLCDISGSMEPYARALLLLLYCISADQGRGGQIRNGSQRRPEIFSFATRLTRLTAALAAATPGTMLAKAGEAAPDWSGGTRIGAALKEFNDRYGSRGMARGAVVLIISDGWETGDPAVLGAQMSRLHRLAHRIVWANPRTQSPRYRPEVGGMAAAWPYCDAIVSAHNLDALPDLLAALRST